MTNLSATKWEKGKGATLRFYTRKHSFKNRDFNRPLNLPDYFAPLIGDKTDVSIAEIGSGMFCTIGSLWPTARISVYPSDILADDYRQVLSQNGITPLIPVLKQDMEHLTYPDKFFDIVHCVNALDHCLNPDLALKEMLRVCKPGGYIYLRHFTNVGRHQNYSGMHFWNIDLNGPACLFWNPDRRFALAEIIPGFIHSRQSESGSDMIVSIFHKICI